MNTLIWASAGTGKTYTLVKKYITIYEDAFKLNKNLNFFNVLTLTFTEKAANEMKERIRNTINEKIINGKENRDKWIELLNKLSSAPISTIHSFCRKIIRESAIIMKRDPYFNVLTGLKKAVIQTSITKSFFEKNLSDLKPLIKLVGVDESYRLLLKSLNNMYKIKYSFPLTQRDIKNKNIGENNLENIEATICFHDISLKLIKVYRDYVKNQNLIDFDDMLLTTYELLEENQDIAERLSERYKFIIVDEFQDTDELQMKIIEKIHKRKTNELFLVGDPKQSIYRFRGADISISNKTRIEFEDSDDQIIKLDRNWRSSGSLVDFQNFFFSRLMPPKSNLSFHKSAYETEIISVDSSNEESKRVFLMNTEVKDQEPERVANIIANLIDSEMFFSNKGEQKYRKIKASDIAVLFRNFNKISKFENAFSKRKIPFFTVGGKNFYDRPEISGLLSFLNVLTDYSDETSLFKLLMSPLVALNLDEITEMKKNNLSLFESFIESDLPKLSLIKTAFEKYSKLKYYLSPGEILQGIIDDNKYLVSLSIFQNSEKLIANVRKLLDIAREMENYGSTLREITKNIKYYIDTNDEREASLESEKSDNVKLMTVHRAKGLEFPIVILADCFFKRRNESNVKILFDRDKFIISNKELKKDKEPSIIDDLRNLEKEKDFEEEKRILYVAFTRAMERLYISVSGKPNTSNPWFNMMGGILFLKEKETDTFRITSDFLPKIELLDNVIYKRVITDSKTIEEDPKINIKYLQAPEDDSYIKYISPTMLLENFSDEYDVIQTEIQPVLQRKPKQLGTLLHLLLQPLGVINDGKSITLDNILSGYSNPMNDKSFFTEKEIEKAKEILNKVKNNRIIKKVEESDFTRSELQIHKKFDRYILMGILDKIIKVNNTWEIIDYKYTFNPEIMKTKHIFQMQFYIYIIKEIIPVEKATLLYLNTGNTFEVFLKNEKDFEKQLLEMIKSYQKRVIEL